MPSHGMVVGYRDGLHSHHPPPVVPYTHSATPTSRQAIAMGSPMTRQHGAIHGTTVPPSPTHQSMAILVVLYLVTIVTKNKY